MEKKSLLMLGLGLGIATALFASLFVFQIVVPAQPAQQMASAPKPAQQLQKFKASGWSETSEIDFLIRDAGKDRGIWANNGLDPEFVTFPGGRATLARDIKDQVASGVQIGIGIPSEVILARSTGLPVKIVAAPFGESAVKIYVKADSPVKTVKDLDGSKIGVAQAGAPTTRHVTYLNSKFGITAQSVPTGNVTALVVALKVGRIDAFITPDGAPLRLVDSGELRIVLRMADVLSKPWAGVAVFATDDLIQQNPELVRKFVKATLEVVKYLKDNPSYAADLFIKKTNAPRELAEKAISQLDWTPDGRGGGLELATGVRNNWQWVIDSGAVPSNVNVKIEEAVDVRFLP